MSMLKWGSESQLFFFFFVTIETFSHLDLCHS